MKDKANQIKKMFSTIAKDYDFLNHFLSFGMDILWRKKVSSIIYQKKLKKIADIACGTGDLSIEIFKKNGCNIIGFDFCFEMLKLANRKTNKIIFINGDATMIPVKKKIFDCITIAFGIRNIPERKKALSEFNRILCTNGYLLILEFDIPDNLLFRFYFKKILPIIGGIFSSKDAYKYLPDSVMKFPRTPEFIKEIEASGFAVKDIISMSLSMVKLYICKKI